MNILDYATYKKKNKSKQETHTDSITNIMKLYDINMFNYEPPGGLLLSTCERTLTTNGIGAFYKCEVPGSVNNGKWCLTPAFPASILDNNNLPSVITTYGTDYALEMDVDKDCILIYNNSLYQPDRMAERYSQLLDDIDKTIKILVIWCRAVPIMKVHDNDDISKYNKLLEKIIDGDLINIISDNMPPLLNKATVTREQDVIDITDSTSAEKIHFLSELREEVIKRIATIYGIPFNTTAKSAQALNAELHGMDIFSLFVPFDRYKSRKECFERAKAFSGHDFKFDWSDIMKHQITDIFNHAVENVENTVENDNGSEGVQNDGSGTTVET